MDREELTRRTAKFALRIFGLVDCLPDSQGSQIIAKQLLRSASSVRSNYRTVPMAKSANDFLHKLQIVAEEADETMGWLEFIFELGLLHKNQELHELITESKELTRIFNRSVSTSKKNLRTNRKNDVK